MRPALCFAGNGALVHLVPSLPASLNYYLVVGIDYRAKAARFSK
jgi:hypothetical protein